MQTIISFRKSFSRKLQFSLGLLVFYMIIIGLGRGNCLAAAWITEIVDNSAVVGYYSSLAIDQTGKLHISYWNSTSGNLKYATNASGAWVTRTLDSAGNTGHWTSLALDSNDKVHISYNDLTNEDLKYATNASGAWVTQTIDSADSAGGDSSIALDSADRVHISYKGGRTSDSDLKYATNASGAWVINTLDTGKVGGSTSIAIDAEDKVHISYYDWLDQDLEYATNRSGSWQIETIDSNGISGIFTSIALDSAGMVHISYGTLAPDQLKYATNASGSWQTEVLNSGTGHYPSIALDANDKIHISYTSDALWYHTNKSGSWVWEIIENNCNARYTSIALDASANVHISYLDNLTGRNDLRHVSINFLPVANAGANLTVNERQLTALDGSGSYDGDDGIDSFQWTQTAGTSVTLSDDTIAEPTFISPGVPEDGELLSFTLTVTDVGGQQATDTCTVTVNNIDPSAPVIWDIGVIDENEPELDWEPVTGVDHYIIEYDDNPGFTNPVSVDDIGPSDYTIATPLNDGTWYWRVKAVDADDNESNWSETGSFTVDTINYCINDPVKPELLSPEDGQANVSPTPIFATDAFEDPDQCSTHWKTRWQISEHSDFRGLTLNVNGIQKNLTSLKVSRLVLKPGTTYYWRVRYWGANGNKSDWSDVYAFTTQATENDDDDDGIPDDEEVTDDDDLDGDNVFDCLQTDDIKSIKAKKGGLKAGIRPQSGLITHARAVDDASIVENLNRPLQIPNGLFAFRLEVPGYGDTAVIKIHLSEPPPPNAKWVFYDTVDGWLDFSGYATLNAARNEVTIELKDGGYGDCDHTENKVIVDPSGFAIVGSAALPSAGGGGGCFVSSAQEAGQSIQRSNSAPSTILILLIVISIFSASLTYFGIILLRIYKRDES